MDTLFEDSAVPREPKELRPGAQHVPGWLSPDAQRWIVDRFHEWGAGPVPPHSTLISGHPMSVKTVCLGWHWSPHGYSREAGDVNGRRVLPMPDWMVRLGRQAVLAATGDHAAAEAYSPDAAIVNYYDATATMGMHRDHDEAVNAPVVSLSIGDSCIFRFGNNEGRTKPYDEVLLCSGDLFVFSGPARWAYHGVRKVHPGTAPTDCGLGRGRINITLRRTGLAEDATGADPRW